MTFIDDFAGLTRAEQIALVQAVAREHGDELTDAQAAQALNLYATRAVADRHDQDAKRAPRAASSLVGQPTPELEREAGT